MEHINRNISWGAIISGTLIAIGLSFLLNLFSSATGLAVFNNSPEGITTLAVSGFIGLLIGSIIIMFFSGWVTGYLAKNSSSHSCTGALYGLIAWCLALALTAILTVSMGNMLTENLRTITTNKIINSIDTMNNNSSIITNQDNDADQQTNQANRAENSANILGEMSLIVFALFFSGAIAMTLGGYYGMRFGKDTRSEFSINQQPNKTTYK